VHVSTAIWLVSDELVVALDDRFGEPTDAYVNGSQVWLRDDGPDGLTLEWRLHPVASYVKPEGVPTVDVFGRIALSLSEGNDPLAAPVTLWEGLEAFSAYDDEIEAETLRQHVVAALGIEPFAVGRVDHELIGDAWERDEGRRSVVADLRVQLGV
jgi:hypothetical protein